ncbi:MAG: nitrite/sulfite reductase [Candidatus Omnitrophica bacterium]|nr:nitrite/sulfite reductase [Candidatus Omnitrophota bacterium]
MAPNKSELIKQQIGDPFKVIDAVKRAASEGVETLTEDDLFLCKWYGLYTHRHEKGYFMLRTKQPNGYVTVEQARTIADIAETQNRGFADITTRQDFQLHWCRTNDLLAILERLKAAGISTLGACGDIARNVVGCPVAGVDREELFDTGPVARQLSDFFLGNRDFANLPRKYKISVSACRSRCVHPEIQCVALVGAEQPVNGKTEPGFDLRVGGGLSTQAFFGQRLGAFVKPDQVVPVVAAVTAVWRDTPEYREKRHHARIKYLIHDWGAERFRQAVEERLGWTLADAEAAYQDPPDQYRDHVGVHAQKQSGYYYVGAPVLVGRITSRQLSKVADLAERYSDPDAKTTGTPIRLTNRQNLVVLNVAESHVDRVLAGLAEAGLSVNAHPVRRSVVTCTGTEFCKLAITETKARSRQIVEYLESRVPLDEPLRLHITGCPNACAQHQIGHIGLMGSKTKVDGQVVDAYDIFVGGQLGQGASFNHPIIRKVPAAECARRLEQLLRGYLKQRKPGEPFNGFCARVGDAELVKLLTDGKPLPSAEGVEVPKVPESEGPVY